MTPTRSVHAMSQVADISLSSAGWLVLQAISMDVQHGLE